MLVSDVIVAKVREPLLHVSAALSTTTLSTTNVEDRVHGSHVRLRNLAERGEALAVKVGLYGAAKPRQLSDSTGWRGAGNAGDSRSSQS